MKIVDIREKTFAVAAGISNADIAFDTMTASALAIITDQSGDSGALTGLAFDSIGRYGHGGLLRERFIPRLLAAEPADYCDATTGLIDPVKVNAVLMRNEKPGGHGERSGAVGLIDAAVWDLLAKAEGKPLWRLLDERYGNGAARGLVPVYGSGGHYRGDGDEAASLEAEVRRYRDDGFRQIKIKIGGVPIDTDLRRIDTALDVLGEAKNLAVDANGSFDEARAEAYISAIGSYGLAWIEEPVSALDYKGLQRFCTSYDGAVATGENIFSEADTRNLLMYGGLRPDRDFLQVDISLSYGLVEYLRILDLMSGMRWDRTRCMPHAGHLFSLQAVAGLGLGAHEAAPDPALPFGGFPEDAVLEEGLVHLGETPGVGFEQKPNLYAVFRELMG